LRSKAKDLTSKAKDFIKCPRGQGHGLEDFITGNNTLQYVQLLSMFTSEI